MSAIPITTFGMMPTGTTESVKKPPVAVLPVHHQCGAFHKHQLFCNKSASQGFRLAFLLCAITVTGAIANRHAVGIMLLRMEIQPRHL